MATNKAAKARLENQLARLMARTGKIEADLRQLHDRDSMEQAVELENDQVLAGLDEMTRREVVRIRAALARIKAGTYGACSVCGEPIGHERLSAIPSAATCLTCSETSA